MNREIKFRVFDPQEKQITNVRLCDYLGFHGIVYDRVGCNNTDNIWMQFAGIHDCNENPIYEGDIIKGGVRIMSVIFKQEACQFWLIWNDDKIKRYEPMSATYGDDTDYFSNDNLEVIGNIYENPELISELS